MITNRIGLDHGKGGEASHELIKEIFLSRLDNAFLSTLDESAVIGLPGCTISMTTDSYVVEPVSSPFPRGSNYRESAKTIPNG